MIIESTGRTVEEAINAALEELKLTREEVDFEILVEPKKGLFGLMNRKAKVLVTPKAESAKKVIGDTDEADSVVDEWKAKATALGEKAMESAEDALRKAGAKADEIDVKQTAFNNKVKAKLDIAIDSAKDAVNEQVDTASAVAAAVKNTLSERRSRKERNAEDAVKNFVVDEAVVEEAKSFLTKVFKAMNVEVVMEKFINKQDGCVILKLHGVDMGILIGKHGQTLDSLQYLTNLVANKNSENRVHIVIDVENYRERRSETLTRLAKRLADKVKKSGERVVLEPMNPHERKIIHTALQNDSRITTLSEGSEPYRKVVIELKK